MLSRTYIWLYVIIAFILVGCASAPQKKLPDNSQVSVESTELSVEKDAKGWLEQAKLKWLQDKDITQRNQLLLNVASQFQTQEQCNQASIVLQHIQASLNQPQRQYSALLQAECMLMAEHVSEQDLALIGRALSEQTDSKFSQRFAIARAYYHAQQEQYEIAASLLIEHQQTSSVLNQNTANTLWEWYAKLTTAQRARLLQNNNQFAAYADLARIIEDTQSSDTDRQQAIQAWRVQYAQHALNQDLPLGIQQFMRRPASNIRSIAVLLPLTGNLSAQGKAIKQGVTSAYFSQLERIQASDPGATMPELVFLDTGSNGDSFVSTEITPLGLSQYDLIIGPLLKEQVRTVSEFSLPTTTALYLNRIEAQQALTNSLFFSLAPEDEAMQLADLMYAKSIQQPVIITNTSAIGQRMVTAFKARWQELNNKTDSDAAPQVINFENNKGMRIGITAALDVLQSQRRIRQMSALTNQTVHSVTRNRRDVDAFVVLAKPEEVELINPIIESSISLFTEQALPVFATSYSYQHQLSKNSIRDLRNLVFVDMPWLMPNYRQGALAQQVDKIWNKPSSAFLRLFAFGYDSFQFTGKVQQQLVFKNNHIQGLTGSLRVNDTQQVVRELPHAIINDERISIIDGI